MSPDNSLFATTQVYFHCVSVLSFLCLFWCEVFCHVQHISPDALFHIGSRKRNISLSSTTALFISWKGKASDPGKAEAEENTEIRSWTNTLITEKLCWNLVLATLKSIVNPQPKPYKNQVGFLNVSACQMQSVDAMRKKNENQVQKHERANLPLKSSERERRGHHLHGTILAWEVWDLKSIIFLGRLSSMSLTA